MTPKDWTSSLRAQLREQATPRAMAGLGLLLIIITLWGLSEASTSVARLRDSVDELERARRLEMRLLSDQGWLEQAETLNIQLARAQDSFWTGATPGIIAAQLQGAVESAARDSGLTRIRVNVESAPETLGSDAALFEISLTARDTNGQFLALLQELSRTEHQLVITRFNWRRSNGSLDIRLRAPARIAVEGADT